MIDCPSLLTGSIYAIVERHRDVMSSNPEASKPAAEGQEAPELHVADKRRFTPEGEPIVVEEAEPIAEPPAEPKVSPQAEIEQLQAKLREAEEKRNDAERRVSEFAERC